MWFKKCGTCNAERQPAVDLENPQPFVLRLCQAEIKQEADVCVTGKPLMTPVMRERQWVCFLGCFFGSKFFIHLRSFVFPKITHLTATHLPSHKAEGVLLGTLTTNFPKILLFSYFYSLAWKFLTENYQLGDASICWFPAGMQYFPVSLIHLMTTW